MLLNAHFVRKIYGRSAVECTVCYAGNTQRQLFALDGFTRGTWWSSKERRQRQPAGSSRSVMTARDAFLCQLQVCNAILIICGLAAVGLAGSQFSKVGIDNFRDVDLRMLNWIHALTGGIGIYSIRQSHGSIVTKTLYCVSLVIGIASAIFYGFTTYRVVDAHDNLQAVQSAPGFLAEFGQEQMNYAGRIAISAIMIGVPALAAFVSLIALFLLERLVVVTSPVYPLQSRDQEVAMDTARRTLAATAVIKFFFGLGVLGLAVFIEYEHEKVATLDRYIKIALEHIAAMLAICSGVIDLMAARKRQEQLNLKVSLALSVIAAVWCIKSVDHCTFPFYKNDLKAYYRGREAGDPSITSHSSSAYILIVAFGVLIGCYGLLFFICAFSAVIVGTYLQLDFFSLNIRIDKGLAIQSRLLGLLHVLWGLCLIALTVLGLLNLQWRGEFLGGDLLWMGILFATCGLLTSSNYSTMITTRFIMNVVCLGISVEKMCAAVNLIYQFSAYDIYVRGDQKTHIGQIVLESITCGVFAAEAVTSLVCCLIYGREVARQPTGTYRHSNGMHLIFSLGTLFYAVVITGCYVVFEVGKWRYSEVPIEVPFFRLGNGPLAFAVFVVQILCAPFPRLLASSSILHIIVAAIAHYTISPAITNVYYLQKLIAARDVLQSTSTQITIYEVALILAAGATLACVLATLCGVVCTLRSSYILHHRSSSPDSTVAVPLGEEFSGQGTIRHSAMGSVPSAAGAQLSPVSVQAREEQSVYWSADENPFYYHTTKRFYGQPYQIESGQEFYGYALANPNQGIHHHRQVQSSSAQTQIGHVFNSS